MLLKVCNAATMQFLYIAATQRSALSKPIKVPTRNNKIIIKQETATNCPYLPLRASRTKSIDTLRNLSSADPLMPLTTVSSIMSCISYQSRKATALLYTLSTQLLECFIFKLHSLQCSNVM